MTVIFLLIPLSVVIAGCFLGAFIWAVRSGQYEDTCTPALRLLLQESPPTERKHPTRAVESPGENTARGHAPQAAVSPVLSSENVIGPLPSSLTKL